MGPALTDAELAALYPHLGPWQRREMEQWYRGRHHAWMQGQEPDVPVKPPWPPQP